MFSFNARLVALVIAPLMVAGCGKQPATSASLQGGAERVVEFRPHTAATNSKKPVGVYVNGRLYPKGEEPTVTATPAPAAPDAGLGNLHVVLNLKGITDYTAKVRVRLRKGDSPASAADVASYDFAHSELVGQSIETTLLNIAPGEYSMLVETLNSSNAIINEETSIVTVVAGKSEDAAL